MSSPRPKVVSLSGGERVRSRALDLLGVIASYRTKGGRGPRARDLCAILGIGELHEIHNLLRELVKAGLVVRRGGLVSAVAITPRGRLVLVGAEELRP